VFPAEAFGVSEKGDIVVGRAGDFFNGFIRFIWTEALGMIDFNEFLQGQGVMEARVCRKREESIGYCQS
jgi:hypothetical protein